MDIDKEPKKEFMALIGQNVRLCRIRRGLTQKELSRLLGVDASTVARIEAGTRSMSIFHLRTMADALQVSYDTLLRPNCLDSLYPNIQYMLNGQSSESLLHLERVIQTIVDEYGSCKPLS